MDWSKWMFALLGLLGLWLVASTILNFQSGIVRGRDGSMMSRQEHPYAFWLGVLIDLVGGALFIAAAVAVIVFRLPLRL